MSPDNDADRVLFEYTPSHYPTLDGDTSLTMTLVIVLTVSGALRYEIHICVGDANGATTRCEVLDASSFRLILEAARTRAIDNLDVALGNPLAGIEAQLNPEERSGFAYQMIAAVRGCGR